MIKLLYVEDEPNLAKIVSETLSTQFDVMLITRGDHVLEAFQSFTPDICVLDVMLPHLDGYTVSKQIRSLDKKIPIIFLTAKNQTEDALAGFNSGGNDFIRKPFSMEELIMRIKNLLILTNNHVQSASSRQRVIALGLYQFYQDRQELIINDKTKRLSHRETELLTLLIENKHATVIRKTILDKIWGDDSFFNSRNLDVYITKLRDYLREDDNIQIITLKGVGYRLVE